MNDEMERRLQVLFDTGLSASGDEELSTHLKAHPEARVEAEGLSQVDAALRGMGPADAGTADWEATYEGVIANLDRALPALDVEGAPHPDDMGEGYMDSGSTFGAVHSLRAQRAGGGGFRWTGLAAAAVCVMAVGTWYMSRQSDFVVADELGEESGRAAAVTAVSDPSFTSNRRDTTVMDVVSQLRDAGVDLNTPRGPRPLDWMSQLAGAPGVYPMRADGAELTFYFLGFDAEEDAVTAVANIEVSQPDQTALRWAEVVLVVATPADDGDFEVVERVTTAFQALEVNR